MVARRNSKTQLPSTNKRKCKSQSQSQNQSQRQSQSQSESESQSHRQRLALTFATLVVVRHRMRIFRSRVPPPTHSLLLRQDYHCWTLFSLVWCDGSWHPSRGREFRAETLYLQSRRCWYPPGEEANKINAQIKTIRIPELQLHTTKPCMHAMGMHGCFQQYTNPNANATHATHARLLPPRLAKTNQQSQSVVLQGKEAATTC